MGPNHWVVAYRLNGGHNRFKFADTEHIVAAVQVGVKNGKPVLKLKPRTKCIVANHSPPANSQWSFYVKCSEAAHTHLVGTTSDGKKWYSQSFSKVCSGGGQLDPYEITSVFQPTDMPNFPTTDASVFPTGNCGMSCGKGITGRQMDDDHMSGKHNHAWGNGIGCYVMRRPLTFIEKVYEVISWFLAIMLAYLLIVCCCCSRDDEDSPTVIVVNPEGYQMPPTLPPSPHVEVLAVRHYGAVPPTTPVVPACQIHPEQMISAFHEGPAEHLDIEIPQDAPVPAIAVELAEEPDLLAEMGSIPLTPVPPQTWDQAWSHTEELSRDSPSIQIEEEPEFNVECDGQVVAI